MIFLSLMSHLCTAKHITNTCEFLKLSFLSDLFLKHYHTNIFFQTDLGSKWIKDQRENRMFHFVACLRFYIYKPPINKTLNEKLMQGFFFYLFLLIRNALSLIFLNVFTDLGYSLKVIEQLNNFGTQQLQHILFSFFNKSYSHRFLYFTIVLL